MSKTLPSKEDWDYSPEIFDVISDDIKDLYCVDIATHQVSVYFVSGNAIGVYDILKKTPSYERAIESYIANNIYKDDQDEMRYVTDFNNVCGILEKQRDFTFHYRVSRGDEIHQYLLKCSSDGVNHNSIIFSFVCEDHQVNDRKLQQSLVTDPLTGLYTKQAFIQHCQKLLDEHKEDDFDIVIMDIKNFRLLNNIYGNKKGNELLKTLARYLLEHNKIEIWGRLCGDQMIGISSAKNCNTKKWISTFAEEFNEISPVPDVVIKWGIYSNVDRNLSIESMCDRAQIALNSIKQDYNQMTAYYDGDISKRHYKEQLYETCFPVALNKNEFVVWYQPKYDPYTKKIVEAEALVRWCREGEIVSPGEFLNVFEEDGLIRQLDEYIFRSVCEYQQRRRISGKPIIPISVNLSRMSMHQYDDVERYSLIAREYGVAPFYLPIEITESADIESSDIKTLVQNFRKLGFPLHMDDYGSGHSSLLSLNVLQFDVLKIDKGLIDFIGEKTGEKILQSTISMAKELNLKIVAEGVENKQQLEFLMKMGCDYIQGYYFSAPLPESEFEIFLQKFEDKMK